MARPKLGNVLFARRVNPAFIPALEAVLTGKAPAPVATVDQGEVGTLKAQLAALLTDVDRLTQERDLLVKKREAWLRATDDQKTAYWRDRALRCEMTKAGREFDQETN